MELGIKGHSTRGDEIIKILEMLGGKNCCYRLTGYNDKYFYYISYEYKYICNSYIGPDEIKGYKIFSLEDFLEKFPYKVGDKVNIYAQKDDIEGGFYIEVAEITSMRWDQTHCRIVYKMKDIDREFCVEDIRDKVDDKINKGMEEKKINQMSLANCDLDEVEIVLGDKFELKIREGKYYAVRKKPTYPTTYEECCEMLNTINSGNSCIALSYLGRPIFSLAKLIIIRDAYWKLAGEQMGLGRPWEPDWDNLSTNHEFILINKGCFTYSSRVLVFPTIEMREAFHENFKDLIEQCKELL